MKSEDKEDKNKQEWSFSANGRFYLVVTEEMFEKGVYEFGKNCGYDENKVKVVVAPKFDENGQ